MLDFNIGAFNAPEDDSGYIDLSVRMSAESNMYSHMIPGFAQDDRGFNTGSFNDPDDYATRYMMNFGLDFNAPVTVMSGMSGMQGDASFDAPMDIVTMSGVSGGNIRFIREINATTTMSGVSDMDITPAYYQQSYMQLDGAFAPGDRIVLDASRLSITKNGENALYMLSGEFFDLNLGPNSIIYSDDAAGRNVLLRITHRDRFI